MADADAGSGECCFAGVGEAGMTLEAAVRMLEVEVEKTEDVELGVGEAESLLMEACGDMAAVISPGFVVENRMWVLKTVVQEGRVWCQTERERGLGVCKGIVSSVVVGRDEKWLGRSVREQRALLSFTVNCRRVIKMEQVVVTYQTVKKSTYDGRTKIVVMHIVFI